MKNKILTLTAVALLIISLFSVTVSADASFTVLSGDNFTSAYAGDDLSNIAAKLETSTQELSSYFKENNLLYFAVSDDKKTQIKLSSFTDNFSSAVNDISYLSDRQLEEFINSVSNDNAYNCNVITNNNRKFIQTKSTRVDSGGTYTVTQYVTICNNQTFYFVGYNEGETTSDDILNAFNGFSITEIQDDKNEKAGTLTLVAIIILIVAFSVLAVIMIVGILKRIKRPESTENQDTDD